MERAILISADCHATAPRELFTEYLAPRWRDEHAAFARQASGTPHAVNPHPRIDEIANWDSDVRLRHLEDD